MDMCTYLHFNGNCEAAFKHYETVLRGKILMMLRYAESPTGEPVKPENANLVMHARLQVGDRLLMASDAPPERFRPAQGFCAQISVDDASEAERIFAGLSEGGNITCPMAETFWATRFGMATDRFGIPWMVNCEKPMTIPVVPSSSKRKSK